MMARAPSRSEIHETNAADIGMLKSPWGTRAPSRPAWACWNDELGERYTVGAEEEIMLLDPRRRSLAQASDAVMSLAIIVSGVLMVLLAERVATFLARNRMYEVLGLFVLLLVGVMLMSEGGHIAHLAFFGYPIEAMAKSTFYFVVVALVLVDIIQSRYQKKLLAEKGDH